MIYFSNIVLGFRGFALRAGVTSLIFFFQACGGEVNLPASPSQKKLSLAASRPHFSSDSAYMWIKVQLGFGARIPGTPAHQACGDWLIAELQRRGARVYEQKGAYKGTPIRNIIGSFGSDTARPRVLLSAHWDSRPWADKDPQSPTMPVPGANDGASGVAVLLEVARHLAQAPLAYPVDIIFWDAEDMGREEVEDSYCLGSQYWLTNPQPHLPAAYAWGIHLDMVGGRQAVFPQEGHSRQYAPLIVERLWGVARELGYERVFVALPGEPITDDPYYLSSKGGIPMVNIIQRDPMGRGFFPEWHTVQDDIPVIDRSTLQAVGETLIAFLYSFSPQTLSPH
ncbi:MAG: M28 family peptidase [Bacteroidia bacterium]|nr:M28 family peptidase [Bacteroidia bacterium]MDW8133529.1 M28 family peptidase [Bacteroidia bacterium]